MNQDLNFELRLEQFEENLKSQAALSKESKDPLSGMNSVNTSKYNKEMKKLHKEAVSDGTNSSAGSTNFKMQPSLQAKVNSKKPQDDMLIIQG